MEEVFRWYATIGAIIAATVIAARVKAQWMGWAFVLFTTSSLAWIIVGLIADEMSLVIQNAVLTVINLYGVWRWLIWSPPEKEPD